MADPRVLAEAVLREDSDDDEEVSLQLSSGAATGAAKRKKKNRKKKAESAAAVVPASSSAAAAQTATASKDKQSDMRESMAEILLALELKEQKAPVQLFTEADSASEKRKIGSSSLSIIGINAFSFSI
jgi:hypothetical protein